MSRASPVHLSRRERQIMDVIYAQGHATAKQVVAAMTDPPSRTAVRTLLRILEEKGHIKHKKQGREFIFQPVCARKRAGRSAFRHVVHTFFNGSLEHALAAHLTDPGAKLTEDELNRLQQLVTEAKTKGG